MAENRNHPGFDESGESLLLPGIELYALDHTSPEPEVLRALSRETHLRTTSPQMLSGHLQGTLLRMISLMCKPKLALEIGTFTGYSAICLASGISQGGTLHTIECNPETGEIASKYFRRAGLETVIHQHIGDAFDILQELNGPFGLVFIDANKDDYIRYFEMVFPKVETGGIILADNTLWYGRVLTPQAATDRETKGIVAFNEYIRNHSGVESLLLPVRDGLTIIRKLKS